ncbi:hypothetical protein [Terrihabitans rhizophilus]|uniref:Uncharacterized protein n=1 Tax=Terrihabitans rhizophilus TaxID=3092662 RepID=A0ABU4RQ40_9HYPH|nr:hypothetical protein [Terrihabitans sp. PJ23]MDX6806982.1 hypothetical protein [Terrihabitans sp. PJ23]
MLRGFATTFGLVATITLGANLYADQVKTAGAAVAHVTPPAQSATTNSNLAAKGDRLPAAPRFAMADIGDGASRRVLEAHALALHQSRTGRFITVARRTGASETTLARTSAVQ